MGKRTMLSQSDRLKGALMNWFLFTYTSVLSTTLKFLSCVSVPGQPDTYMFLNATLDCNTTAWLAPLYLVLLVLVGGSAALPWFIRYLHRRPQKLPGVYRILTDPYTDKCYWWEAALLAQRLLLAFFNTFLAQNPLLHLLFAALVCLISAFLHLVLRPIRHPRTQISQTAFQFSLVVTTIVNVAWAQFAQDSQDGSLVLSASAARARDILDTLTLLFVYIVPAAAIALPLALNAAESLPTR